MTITYPRGAAYIFFDANSAFTIRQASCVPAGALATAKYRFLPSSETLVSMRQSVVVNLVFDFTS